MYTFQQAVRERDFAVTAELPLKPSSTAASIAADLAVLRGVSDAVQVTDSNAGVPHMSPLVAAMICLREGVDPVVQLTGRDRNRIALQSDLLGAAAAGVTSLLLMRGDKLPSTLTPQARKVYEFGAKRLLRCAYLISGESALIRPPGFFLGSMVRVLRPRQDWLPKGLESKVEVGCQFVQTQPLLDVEKLRAYMARLVQNHMMRRVSVIVSIPLLTSAANAGDIMQRTRRPAIPADIVARIRDSKNLREEGISICAETLRAVRAIPGVAGANVVAIDDCRAAVEAVSLSGIRDG